MDRIGLTFDEYVDLKVKPRAGADAAFQRVATMELESMFPITSAVARQAERRAVTSAADIRILADRLKQDILSLAGPPLADRQELFDFAVGQLALREKFRPRRIGRVRRTLELRRDDLPAFAGIREADTRACCGSS